GAEAVQDRPVVAAELREVGVGVQRVHVARETVEERLLRERLHGDRLVGGRSGGRLRGPLGPRSPPKPPSPRAKMLAVLRKRRRPFGSTLSVSTTTTAPFTLS